MPISIFDQCRSYNSKGSRKAVGTCAIHILHIYDSAKRHVICTQKDIMKWQDENVCVRNLRFRICVVELLQNPYDVGIKVMNPYPFHPFLLNFSER